MVNCKGLPGYVSRAIDKLIHTDALPGLSVDGQEVLSQLAHDYSQAARRAGAKLPIEIPSTGGFIRPETLVLAGF